LVKTPFTNNFLWQRVLQSKRLLWINLQNMYYMLPKQEKTCYYQKSLI